MHIRLAIGIFIVFYLLQLLLFFKVKNKHVKMIPLYFCLVLSVAALLLYAGVFGCMSMGMLGNGHVFAAVVIFIAVFIMLAGMLLAKVTHLVFKWINQKNK
ncbi:MAG: hypothetical protein IJ297_02045 [Clostridia bacterium]|nr:hypothetical protein [Clostridia bacterium]